MGAPLIHQDPYRVGGDTWIIPQLEPAGPGLDHEFWVDSFLHENRLAVDWHSLLDPTKFDAHVEHSARLRPAVIASAHGPVLTGPYVEEADQMTRQLARLERVDQPGQAVPDQMVTAIAAA